MTLFELLGSPFVDRKPSRPTDDELLAIYDQAFPNRVALLYLEMHRREGWSAALEEKYQVLKRRESMTFDVIARLGAVLNDHDPDAYVVFKSIKPYPATPNDTDVICLSDAAGYERMYEHLLSRGYVFHEWAPQQRTVYDERGAASIGKGKKGGTYYIDLYSEISTDYFSYMSKARLRPHILTRRINDVPVKLLRAEPELAIVLFHSVFPERTFQLEHFYYPLYTLASPDFDTELFLRFCRESSISFAIATQASLIAKLHQKHFGFVPAPIETILARFGWNERECRRFEAHGNATPYMFSPQTFWTAFAHKCAEWHSLRSLGVQGVKMLNPAFFVDVMRSIRKRMSEKGVYHLE